VAALVLSQLFRRQKGQSLVCEVEPNAAEEVAIVWVQHLKTLIPCLFVPVVPFLLRC